MADSDWSLEARVIGVGDCRPISSAKVITLIGTSRSSIGDPRGFVWRPATCERGCVGVPASQRGNRAAGAAGAGSGAVLEAPALVSGFDDPAMMCRGVEQDRGDLGVAEDALAPHRPMWPTNAGTGNPWSLTF